LTRDYTLNQRFPDQTSPLVSCAGSQGSRIVFRSQTTRIIESILNTGQRTLCLLIGSSKTSINGCRSPQIPSSYPIGSTTASEKRPAGILRGTSSGIHALALG
jgi:hypothetical protein